MNAFWNKNSVLDVKMHQSALVQTLKSHISGSRKYTTADTQIETQVTDVYFKIKFLILVV